MSCNKIVPDLQAINGIIFRKHCEFFAVSACGQVVGKLGRVLKQRSNGHYSTVAYYAGYTTRNKYVHRMVATVFVENPTALPYVNHIDGDRDNNASTNLEWCTAKENTAHAISTGLHTNCPTTGQHGFQKSPNAKSPTQHDAKLVASPSSN